MSTLVLDYQLYFYEDVNIIFFIIYIKIVVLKGIIYYYFYCILVFTLFSKNYLVVVLFLKF